MLIIATVWACAESQPEACETASPPATTGTVERSELALTMRYMYDKMKLASDSIEQGYRVNTDFLEKFKTIHTAKATEPEKIDETYHAMASFFLASYERFENDPGDQKEAFNAMIESCLSCHQHQCPGPVKVINKLLVN